MQEKYLGNNIDRAMDIARHFFSDASSFHPIDDGQENLIIVVDNKFVIRFPRSKEIWERGVTERRVLERLASVVDMPVPRLLEVSDDPAFIATTYLHGNQLSAEQLRSLPEDSLELIGKNIAEFAFMLHEKLSVQEFEPLIQPPTWSYDGYLKRELFKKTNENPRVDALAKEYYQRWITKRSGEHKAVIHDDLHMGNLLFDDGFGISGVLDFGAICIGTPEQELRQTYRLGEAGFEAAISTYEILSGQSLDRELAKLWTITQELASYCRDDTAAVHKRAQENLQFWFPELFIR